MNETKLSKMTYRVVKIENGVFKNFKKSNDFITSFFVFFLEEFFFVSPFIHFLL